jgi:hypothetical protein
MSRKRKHPASPFEGEDDAELVYLDSFTERPTDAPWGEDDVDFEVTVEEPLDLDDLDELDDLFEVTVVEPEEGDTLPRPAGTRTPLPRALALLGRVNDPDDVLDLLTFSIIPGASCIVVLLVRDRIAHGLRASGTRLDQEEVRALVAPSEGLLHRALEERVVVRGSASEDHTQQLISRYLRAPEPTEACVAPVVLGKRVVNLVCVQTALPEGIRDEAVEAVEHLRAAAAAAFLRAIRARKAPEQAQQAAAGQEEGGGAGRGVPSRRRPDKEGS